MTSPTPLIPTLETFLKLTASREQSISANMANVDTPGYHTKDFNFEGELAKAYPGVNLNANQVFTFEALFVAADAYKRACSTDPNALADAIRTTNITDNVSIGGGIQFNAKGQNDRVQCGVTQNRSGKLVTLAPKAAANAKPEWPMTPYLSRG